MAKEYIEREAEDYWCECCCNFDKENVGMDGTATCKLTGCLAYCQEYGGNCKGFKVPAADVEKVRHARFKWGHQNGQYGIWCTDCGAGWVDSENAELIAKTHDYCPKCGAKMDGKGEGE